MYRYEIVYTEKYTHTLFGTIKTTSKHFCENFVAKDIDDIFSIIKETKTDTREIIKITRCEVINENFNINRG